MDVDEGEMEFGASNDVELSPQKGGESVKRVRFAIVDSDTHRTGKPDIPPFD